MATITEPGHAAVDFGRFGSQAFDISSNLGIAWTASVYGTVSAEEGHRNIVVSQVVAVFKGEEEAINRWYDYVEANWDKINKKA